MACWTIRVTESAEQREARLKKYQEDLTRLEVALLSGSVTVAIGDEGSIAFQGWEGSRDLSDTCAFHHLEMRNSFALHQAIEMAESLSGKKISKEAIASGLHSHDGGKTWGRG